MKDIYLESIIGNYSLKGGLLRKQEKYYNQCMHACRYICKPKKTLSHAYNRYFIDDYTHITWVYFLRQKYKVFTIFKKFKYLVEKERKVVIILIHLELIMVNNINFMCLITFVEIKVLLKDSLHYLIHPNKME